MATWLPICHVKQRGNRNAIDWRSIQSDKKGGDFNRLGLPKMNSYNRNCNPNRKIFMTIKYLCFYCRYLKISLIIDIFPDKIFKKDSLFHQ